MLKEFRDFAMRKAMSSIWRSVLLSAEHSEKSSRRS